MACVNIQCKLYLTASDAEAVAYKSESSHFLTMQIKSEKWGCMFVDLMPGDKVAGGSVIQCHVENPEPKVSLFNIAFCCVTLIGSTHLMYGFLISLWLCPAVYGELPTIL